MHRRFRKLASWAYPRDWTSKTMLAPTMWLPFATVRSLTTWRLPRLLQRNP